MNFWEETWRAGVLLKILSPFEERADGWPPMSTKIELAAASALGRSHALTAADEHLLQDHKPDRWLGYAAAGRPSECSTTALSRLFAIAGTAEECLATAARYGGEGVHELVLTFVGAQAAEQMVHLGRALAEHRV